jgi:DNA-binding LacI/PurR family transcriptional regulator
MRRGGVEEKGTMRSRVTIVDVAARAGVAISSASSALNGRPGVSEATRERVQKAARELGFVPSIRGKSLQAKRAFAVGLIVQRDADVLEADPFFAGFIGGIESVISGRDYALVLQMSSGAEENTERYRRLALDRRVDGVFLSEVEDDDARIPLLRDLKLPAVAINSRSADGGFPAVLQDNVAAIQELVDYLHQSGHRRFGHVSGPLRYVHARQRKAAWSAALHARGLPEGVSVESDFTYEGGVAAANRLLAGDDRPTAVFCANDLMAAGFVARAIDLGVSVPGDVSVAGFDGITLGTYVRPSLTTLTTSPRALGAEAARLLLAHIDGTPTPDVHVEPSRLLIRESTTTAP